MKNIKYIKLNNINFVFLILFFIDSVLHIGRHIGTFDFLRPLLMVLLIFPSVFLYTRNNKIYSCFYAKVLFLFACFIVYSYFIAWYYRQNSEIANEFVLSFIYLFFFPCMLFCIRSKEDIIHLLHIITLIGTIVSFCCLSLVMFDLVNEKIAMNILVLMKNFNLGFELGRSNGLLRFISTAVTVQIMAYFFAIYFLLYRKKNIYILISIINLVAIFVTFTRGLWLGVAFGSVYLLLKYITSHFPPNTKIRLIFVFGIILIFLAIVALYHINPGFITYAIERIRGNNGTKESDSFRREMLKMVYELINRHPYFGNGAGACINLRDGRIEMSLHDMASKIGVFGLIIFLLPLLKMIFEKDVNKRNMEFRLLQICSLSALISLVVATNTNPYFITSFGLFLYSLCMRIYSYRDFPISGYQLESTL